jgi:sugar phosphate isomerase/epimerase
VAEDLVELGADWGIVPWIAPDKRTEAALRAYGEQFNGYADALARRGVKFAYHNHDFEFTQHAENGQDLFDMLMTVTDASRVYFELDAYWASVAGRDPAEVISRYRERIRLVHLKDGFTDNLVHGGDVPFGEGNLDFTELFKAAAASKVEYYITEQDTRKDVESEIAQSFRNAAAVLG